MVVDDDRGVIKGHPNIGQARFAQVPPRQPLEPRCQVIAEEADHASLKGRIALVGLFSGLGKPPSLEQSLEDGQNVAFTALNDIVIRA